MFFLYFLLCDSLILLQKDDPDLDCKCVVPPNCISFDKLCQWVTHPRGIGGKSESQPIHVHINNHPLAGSGVTDQNVPIPNSHKCKCSELSSSDDNDSSDSESESLTISEILDNLHQQLPKLNLPQYKQILADCGIAYVECVSNFDREYYIELGMAEGAVGPFLKGVDKALCCEKWWRAWSLLWGEKESCEQVWNKPKPTNTNTKSNTNQKHKTHIL